MPNAAPIVYTFFGVGSGNLGPDTFSVAPFAITFPTNTNKIYPNPVLYAKPALQNLCPRFTGSISIFGLETAPFKLQTAILEFGLTVTVLSDTESNLFRVSVGLDPDILFAVASPALAKYALDSSIEPVSGLGSFSDQVYPTTGGNLLFSSVSSAAFKATVVAA